MESLTTITIRKKLFGIALIQLILLLYFASIYVFEVWSENRLANNMRMNSELMMKVSQLITDVQVERGTSNIYMNGGAELSVLQEKRAKSDMALTSLNEFVAQQKLDQSLEKNWNDIGDALKGLRENTDKKDKEIASGIIKGYTGAIRDLLNFNVVITKRPTTKGIGKLMLTVVLLEEAREFTGRLRAHVSGLLARNSALSDEEYQNLIAFRQGMIDNLHSPVMNLRDGSTTILKTVETSAEWGKVQEVYLKLLQTPKDGNWGFEAKDFFQEITKVIEQMKQMEFFEISEMQKDLQLIASEATRAFYISILSSLFIVLLVLVLTLKVIRQIDGTINLLLTEINRLVVDVKRGVLKTRISSEIREKCSVEFRPLLSGLNEMLEAFVRPITRVVEAMQMIGKGQMPPAIEDHYEGDFESLKISVNSSVLSITELIQNIEKMVVAAEYGRLSERIDENRFLGSFQKIALGINSIFLEVMRPINEAKKILSLMAEGNLRERMEDEYKGDYLILKEALNQSLQAISNTLIEVRDNINEVKSNGNQVAKVAQALAQGATEQAAALEEISSTMHGIGALSRDNAQSAGEANSLSESTRISSQEGRKRILDVITAMNGITESSQSVASIIKVIDEIAFQTNLLALNAAVEAARAGKYGKGFAVVATEVRNLASKSAKATQETTVLIGESNTRVAAGGSVAEETQVSLGKILTEVEKIDVLIKKITKGSQEQAEGVSQVVMALTQIDQVTQQAAASTEETASIAVELSQLGEKTADLVAQFKL